MTTPGPIERGLRAAREKIRKPEAWIRLGFARNADMQWVSPRNPMACTFCMEGAIEATVPPHEHGFALAVAAETVGGNVAAWNDRAGRTHAHIIAAMGLAMMWARRMGL